MTRPKRKRPAMPAKLRRVAISITMPPDLLKMIDARGFNRSETICGIVNDYCVVQLSMNSMEQVQRMKRNVRDERDVNAEFRTFGNTRPSSEG